MVKANELMIGDIVRVSKDVCIKKGTIVKIRGIDADRVFPEKGLKGCATCVPIDNPDGLSGGVWLEYLEPIPLTDDILKANGFEYREWYYDYYSFDQWNLHKINEKGEYGGTIITINRRKDGQWMDVRCNTNSFWHVKYVHQLQNFLQLCGIDKKIKLEG